jgi:hypothetical protein
MRVVSSILASHKMGEEQFSAMPNIETLWLRNANVGPGFLQSNPYGPRANTKLLPSLRPLHLENATGGWRSLMTSLKHQTSNNQAILFELLGNCHRVPPKVVQEIVRGLVRKFVHERILNSEGSDEDEYTGC